MKKLACKDLSPDTDCTYESTGATAEDAARDMLAHARVEHTADIASMSDDEVVKAFSAKAHD